MFACVFVGVGGLEFLQSSPFKKFIPIIINFGAPEWDRANHSGAILLPPWRGSTEVAEGVCQSGCRPLSPRATIFSSSLISSGRWERYVTFFKKKEISHLGAHKNKLYKKNKLK